MKAVPLSRPFCLLLSAVVCILAIQSLAGSDDKAAASPALAGRKWAIVIGVDKYRDKKISRPPNCVADANLMADSLRDHCGFEEGCILRMTTEATEPTLRPTRINFEETLHEWLRKATPDDTVVVFFAGHGYLDSEQRGVLATEDCRKDDIGRTGYRTSYLKDKLLDCKAKRKLLILDCCHSGVERGGGDEPEGVSSAETATLFERAEGLITLASCQKDEKSYPSDDKKHGLFTSSVVAGLKGAADRDGDGIVTTDEIYVHASRDVPTAATKMGFTQTPKLIHDSRAKVGIFALANVPRRVDRRSGSTEYRTYYDAGAALAANGKNKAAADAFGKAIASWPESSHAHYGRGKAMFGAKDYESAIRDFSRVIDLDRDNAKVVYVMRGEAQRLVKNYEDAISDFTKAVELDDRFVLSYALRAETYSQRGQLDLAIRDYSKAISLAPRYSCLYVNRAQAHRYNGNDDLALKDLNEVIRLGRNPLFTRQDWNSPYVYQPETSEYCWCPQVAYALRCLIFANKNDTKRALEEGDKAVANGERYAWGHYARSHARFRAGNASGALEDLNKAVEYGQGTPDGDHNLATYYYGRSQVHAALGRRDQAEADRKKAIELNPSFAQRPPA
jgi:tetratricopeptide (TPR) repeat protein